MVSEDLQNVYFDIGKHTIDAKAAAVMDRMAELLEKYDDPVIELHAYADATGSYNENILLTEKRARSVIQYLIDKGVPKERMSYRAYGESSLSQKEGDDVRTDRRVEFRLNFFQHPQPPAGDSADWPGYGTRDLAVLEPETFYVQLAALGPNSMFNGFKLKEYGTTICYFQSGMYKYVLGPFLTSESAKETLQNVRKDYRDAFMFKNY